MAKEIFQYYRFYEHDGLVYGRPHNERKKFIPFGEGLIPNPAYIFFEKFADQYDFEAFTDEIKPGLYARGDIFMIPGADDRRYYGFIEHTLQEMD